MKNTLNILKNKIKFTYEPIPDIFKEISNNSNKNIGQIFKKAEEKMEKTTADVAWEQAVEETNNNLKYRNPTERSISIFFAYLAPILIIYFNDTTIGIIYLSSIGLIHIRENQNN